MKNVPNLRYHFQSACCMIDSCFELLVELMIRWLTGAWLSGPVSMDPVSTVNRYLIQAWHIWLIWQLQFGLLQNQVAALFQVRPSTISKLKVKFHIMGGVRDSPWALSPDSAYGGWIMASKYFSIRVLPGLIVFSIWVWTRSIMLRVVWSSMPNSVLNWLHF